MTGNTIEATGNDKEREQDALDRRLGIGAILAAALALVSAGCAGDRTTETSLAAVARAQAIGKTDSTDMADHDCRIVLRSVKPLSKQSTTVRDCDEEGCRTTIVVKVDVDMEIQGTVFVLFHSAESGDDAWRQVEAEPVGPGGAGYLRYEAKITDPLPTIESGQPVSVIPFLVTDQGRLFDHNVLTNDLASYQIDNVIDSIEPSNRICTHRPNTSELVFDTVWNEFPVGTLRAGSRVAIRYAPSRLPDCRGSHNGFPAWNMEAFVRFLPGGQTASGPVVAFRNHQGRPTSEFYPIPFLTQVPDDATSMEVWFHNASGAGNDCDAWDSNYGTNYHFDVHPPRAEDPCADSFQWQTNGSIPRPFCPDYQVSADYDATNCEFYPTRVSDVQTGHYGIPEYWLEASLDTSSTAGDVAGLGIYVEYLDRSDNTEQHAWIFGVQKSPRTWLTGFDYLATIYPDAGHRYEIHSFAFFMDQRRSDGSIVRLWLSRGGANYTWDDAFGASTHMRYIPYGRAYDADSSAPVFDGAWSCR